MVFQVIGKQRKIGVYEGKEYDNTMLYVTAETPNVTGCFCTAVKAKTCYVPTNLELGDFVDVYYDRYGNAVAINILKKGE